MKVFFLTILFGSSFTILAYADSGDIFSENGSDNERMSQQSYYEILGEMYQNGSKPDASKLLNNLWSGRCFKKDFPYEPVNGAYHLRKKSDDEIGPIAGNSANYEAASVWMLSEEPDYFDDKETWVFSLVPHFTVFDYEDSITFKDENMMSRLRSNGEYLIDEIIIEKRIGPLFAESNPLARCYYFIPEYNSL